MDSLDTLVLFQECLLDCEGDAETLQAVFIDTPGGEQDKKSILEQAFRDAIHSVIIKPPPHQEVLIKKLNGLVTLSINSAELGVCFHTAPFILLGDILDCVTLDVCDKVFEFVESQVSTWTKQDFYSSGKILLLRMCNDLLRRLSATQNTVFCGRIQLFLARLFPLSEKSALNLMSHFNLENVTLFNKDAGVSEEAIASKNDEAMEIDSLDEEIIESAAPIDFNLYHKLWSLQDFFRQPTLCYVSDQWKTLTSNTQEILQAFSSYKLDQISSSSSSSSLSKSSTKRKRKHSTSLRVNPSVEYSESHYFAKFLTSEKLMNLQLKDCHFRRHVLIQLLILFQYLTSEVRFKTSSHLTSESQTQWIKEASEKVYVLLEETPPNGKEFAAYVQQVLSREENWISWKNDGCPSYEKPPLKESELSPYPPLSHLGDKLHQSKIDMGSPELSRLWNLCPDNLQACKLKSRIFVPEMEQFLQEPIDQADPNAKIEPEYKMINNPNFTWQTLRLLGLRSPHFFQNTTTQIKPLPEYLEHVIIQTGRDFQQQQATT